MRARRLALHAPRPSHENAQRGGCSCATTGGGGAGRLCISAARAVRADAPRVQRQPPWGQFGRAELRRFAFLVGQDSHVVEHLHLQQEGRARRPSRQRTTAAGQGGPRGLPHPQPLPSRRGGMVGMDRIAGLPAAATGFDVVQSRVVALAALAVPRPRLDARCEAVRARRLDARPRLDALLSRPRHPRRLRTTTATCPPLSPLSHDDFGRGDAVDRR